LEIIFEQCNCLFYGHNTPPLIFCEVFGEYRIIKTEMKKWDELDGQ
jgi:hypothetical protein